MAFAFTTPGPRKDNKHFCGSRTRCESTFEITISFKESSNSKTDSRTPGRVENS